MAFYMTKDYEQTSRLGDHFVDVWGLLETLALEITMELDNSYFITAISAERENLRIMDWLPWFLPRTLTSFGLATALVSCILPRPFAYMLLYPGFRLVFGTLYPAYASYKAVRTKNVKEYVKWMMYWIVFALFTSAETFTDLFFSFWFPFYYELKIILVIYLLSPATKGSSILYRKFVHPALTRREQEIDEYIARAKEQGYHTVLSLGSKGVNYATTILMQTAIRGGGGLVNHIRKSYSLTDLPGDPQLRKRLEEDETDDTFSPEVRVPRRRRGTSSPRTVSGGSPMDMYFNEVDVRSSPSVSENFLPSHIRSSEDVSSGYVSPDPMAARHDAKDRLVRSSSVSITNRVRTRASAKAERTSSMTEEADDEASDLGEESLGESSPPTTMLESPATGKSIDPLVRPHLKYLFSNLTEDQLFALVSSATSPNSQSVLAAPVVESQPTLEKRDEISQDTTENCFQSHDRPKDPPSLLLNALIRSQESPKKTSDLENEMSNMENKVSSAVDNGDNNEENTTPSDEEFKDCAESEASNIATLVLKETQSESTMAISESPTENIVVESDNKAIIISTPLDEPQIEVSKVIRRPKKRQAPVPPVGGSLVDLTRLSQISDQLEVSSLLDFDVNIQSYSDSLAKDTSVELEKRHVKNKGKLQGESQLSKMLNFPKLAFPFWHKNKQSSPSPDVQERPSPDEVSPYSGSFVSLHDDEPSHSSLDSNRNSSDLSDRLREMSQSPSSKRRSFVF